MIGRIIGDWTIIAEAGKNKHFLRLWKCRCTCGYETIFTTSYINTECIKKCKLCRLKEEENKYVERYVGKKFGKWTVIKYQGYNKHGSRKWLCRCDCGTERFFGTSYFNGRGSGCRRIATLCRKCYSYEYEMNNRIYEITHRFWKRFEDHSRRRNQSVNLTRDEAQKIYDDQNGKCALTGVPLYFTKFRGNYKYCNASMDRIDSSKSYSKENVQWVHKKINIMKHTSSQEDFITLCRYVVNFADGKNTDLAFPSKSLFSK